VNPGIFNDRSGLKINNQQSSIGRKGDFRLLNSDLRLRKYEEILVFVYGFDYAQPDWTVYKKARFLFLLSAFSFFFLLSALSFELSTSFSCSSLKPKLLPLPFAFNFELSAFSYFLLLHTQTQTSSTPSTV
jgi:hypothetical protein